MFVVDSQVLYHFCCFGMSDIPEVGPCAVFQADDVFFCSSVSIVFHLHRQVFFWYHLVWVWWKKVLLSQRGMCTCSSSLAFASILFWPVLLFVCFCACVAMTSWTVTCCRFVACVRRCWFTYCRVSCWWTPPGGSNCSMQSLRCMLFYRCLDCVVCINDGSETMLSESSTNTCA